MIKKQHLDLKSEPNLGREKVKSDRKKRKRNLDLGRKLKSAPPKNRCKIIDHADAFLNISVAIFKIKTKILLELFTFQDRVDFLRSISAPIFPKSGPLFYFQSAQLF